MAKKDRIDTPFNTWLDRQLKRKGWKPVNLANEAGFAKSTISRWYSEGRGPDVASIKAIVETLDVHPDELLDILELRESAADRISPEFRRIQKLMEKTEWTDVMLDLLEENIKYIQSVHNKSSRH